MVDFERLKIAFYTFGCRLNQSETSVIERSFENRGYHIVPLNENPDIVVVNTCTVTENGDAATKSLVNKINRLTPSAKIALVGCQAQIQKDALATLPNVRWIVGNAQKMELASIIGDTGLSQKIRIITPSMDKRSFTLPAGPVARMVRGHTRANLKIQDGCDFFCTFCEIPFARGRARSRVFEDILSEGRALTAAGHKELIITGVNLGTYRFQDKTILDIVDSLDDIDGLRRIRISSIEPTTIPFELIERMKTTKLCRHLHIPLQSGSEKILTLMQRKYTPAEFSEFITKAHQTVPGICIGTDVIVGFPGETDSDFKETLDFLRDLPLAYIHVFSYSDRTLNKSRNFENKVPLSVIRKRSQILRDLSSRKRSLFVQSLLNTSSDVLFEGKKNEFWFGLTDNYIRVKLKSRKLLHNTIAHVRIKTLTGQGQMEG